MYTIGYQFVDTHRGRQCRRTMRPFLNRSGGHWLDKAGLAAFEVGAGWYPLQGTALHKLAGSAR